MLGRVMRVLLVVGIVLGWSGGAAQSQVDVDEANAPVGNAISYQGWLQQAGAAVNGVCDLRFALFDAVNNGAQIGSTLTRPNHVVTSGYFTVNDLNFGNAFTTGQARWLEVAVRCPAGSGDFTTLTPRQPLTPAPYALYALYATNNWALAGNVGTNANHFLGTRDAVTLTLKVSNTVALRLLPNATSPNIVGGIEANGVTAGVVGATIAGGGAVDQGVALANKITDHYGVISGGSNNQAGDNAGTPADRAYATVGGGENNVARSEYSTISGGKANGAIAIYATVGGGVENNALAGGATVAGGAENAASGEYATVSGGIANSASAANATVAGGTGNEASGEDATIGGGDNNSAVDGATVAGGTNNQANGGSGTIGGGNGNVAGEWATVGGGSTNQALAQFSTVAGGTFNEAHALHSTVGGGNQNIAVGQAATVSGGFQNEASSSGATVAGGNSDLAGASDATVSGGNDNIASGTAATISGGRFNEASANFATISGGVDVHASHYGEWAYAAGGFANDLTGEAQTSIYILRATTANNAPTVLGLGDFSEPLTIAPGRTVVFEIQVAARSVGGESAGYSYQGVIENHLGITTLLGGGAASPIQEDDPAWGVAVAADDGSDSLKLTVTGNTGDSVRWVATVRTTEVQN